MFDPGVLTNVTDPRLRSTPMTRGSMRLYDTAVGEVVDFTPGDLVTMYVCGITPYDATHLGHAATYVTYDILQRRLLDLGHEVRYVRNITDVDDDLLRAADQRGVHYLDLAFGETARFDDDMKALNTLPPWSEPRATGVIANIRGIVDTLLTQGVAYQADDNVYFDTAAAADFGALSRLGNDRMEEISGEWGEQLDDPNKRTRSTSCCGGRAAGRALLGSTMGERPARVARGMQRSRPARTRSDDRSARRRRRSAVSPPRMLSGPVRSGDRPTLRPPLDASGDGASRRAQDVQVDREPRSSSAIFGSATKERRSVWP